jgi:CheY-like chemotaxis protein
MWAQKGMLKAEVTPGGHRRYMLQEVKRFARSHGITLQVANEDEYRVLIVDDEPDWRELLAELLRANSQDIVIETAADGFEAGRKVSGFKPHLVLLDLMMPGIDGAQVCRAIKGDPETSSARVFCISGYIDDESEARLMEAGIERCFAKPIDSNELLDAIGLAELKPATKVVNHH